MVFEEETVEPKSETVVESTPGETSTEDVIQTDTDTDTPKKTEAENKKERETQSQTRDGDNSGSGSRRSSLPPEHERKGSSTKQIYPLPNITTKPALADAKIQEKSYFKKVRQTGHSYYNKDVN